MQPTEEDRQVFVDYGATMLVVQAFEWTLKRLAVLYSDTQANVSMEGAWKVVEETLQMPVGPLVEQLKKRGRVPENLLGELREAGRHRNYLAHEFLLVYWIKKLHNRAAPSEEMAFLQKRRSCFQQLQAFLQQLVDTQSEAIESESSNYEEVRKIAEEIIPEDEFWEAHPDEP